MDGSNSKNVERRAACEVNQDEFVSRDSPNRLKCCLPVCLLLVGRGKATACSDPIAVYDYRPQSEPGIFQITLLGRQKLNTQKILARNQNNQFGGEFDSAHYREKGTVAPFELGWELILRGIDLMCPHHVVTPFAPFGLADFQQNTY